MQFPHVQPSSTNKDTHNVTRLLSTHTLGNRIIDNIQVTRFTSMEAMNLGRLNT